MTLAWQNAMNKAVEKPVRKPARKTEAERKEVMVSLADLWIPILLSAVVVFIVSSIVHMALPWHENDYPKVPNEDAVRAALRPLNIPPGGYMVPRSSSQTEMGSPEFQEKMKAGPVLMLQVMPNGMMPMTIEPHQLVHLRGGHQLLLGVYHQPRGRRRDGLPGRSSGSSARPRSWAIRWPCGRTRSGTGSSWVVTMKSTIDGLIYACFTAGVFGWLWPR